MDRSVDHSGSQGGKQAKLADRLAPANWMLKYQGPISKRVRCRSGCMRQAEAEVAMELLEARHARSAFKAIPMKIKHNNTHKPTQFIAFTGLCVIMISLN
jgi:hypothetical protein